MQSCPAKHFHRSTQNKSMKYLLTILAAAMLAGCVSSTQNPNIVAVKSTTFGFDVSGDPQTSVPHVRIGLVRNFYQLIPVRTNQVFSPSYATSMSAEMRLTSQRGQEDFATGEAANLISASNTVAKIGAEAANIQTPAFAPAVSGVSTNK
jgi:hypothetical protein